MKKIINTEKAAMPIGPYNQAILSKDRLYISGQIAIHASSGEMVTGNIEDETRQVMRNLKAILEEADMDFSNVVKCSIFVKDLDNFEKINEVYGNFFYKNFPARETVQVAALPKNANIEISAIAIK